MKNKNPFFSIILLSFLIFSCKQTASNKMEENVESYSSDSFLTVMLQDSSSRTILPEKYDYTDFEYELYGTAPDGKQSLLQHWSNYESMISSKVNIKTGEWIFELYALKNSEIALTGVVSATIQLGENKVSFTLTELSYGNGNLFIELYLSENVAQKIEAQIFKEDGSPMEGYRKTVLLKDYDFAKGKNKAIYQLNNIRKGYYLVRFFLYTHETDSDYSAVYNTFARIEPCFTSSGIEEIDLSENLYEVSIQLDHIEIAKKPSTTVYYAEQNLSLAGMEVNACYKDGRKEKITNYTTSIEEGAELTLTDKNVTIAYGEFTDSFSISVMPNTLNSVYVTVPSMEQDMYGLLYYSYDTNIFTADRGFSTYEWWLDGEILNNNQTRYFEIDSSILSSGNHNLMLVTGDNSGKKYSASSEFVIYDSSLSFIKVAIGNIKEVSDLLSFDETSFTAAFGFMRYVWWLDDVIQSTDDEVFTLAEDLNPGHHTITVIVKDNDENYFSETKTVTITKDNLKIDNEINTKVTVKILDFQDVNELLSYDESSQRFTAKKGYVNYVWWIDGTKQIETSKSFILKESDYSIGNHVVMLVVTDSLGNTYSESKVFTISGNYTDSNCANTVIYVILPKYQEVEDLLIYEDSLFYAKTGFANYTWWVDDVKTSQEGKRFSIGNLSKGNHTLMLVAESTSGDVYSSTAEIVIY